MSFEASSGAIVGLRIFMSTVLQIIYNATEGGKKCKEHPNGYFLMTSTLMLMHGTYSGRLTGTWHDSVLRTTVSQKQLPRWFDAG